MEPIAGELDSTLPQKPPTNRQQSKSDVWIWGGALVLLAIGSIIIGFLLPGPEAAVSYAAISIGYAFAAAGVVAVWLAFESYPIGWRLLFGLPTLLALSAALGWYVLRTDGPMSIVIAGVGCLWGQCIVTQTPLWILRLVGSWRLTSEPIENGTAQKTQFGIGHMMIATAVVGVLVALGKSVAPYIVGASLGSSQSLKWVMLFATIAVGNSLTTLCVLWFFASRKYWFLLLLAIGIVVAIVAAAEIAQIAAFGPIGFWEAAIPFALFVNGFSLGMIGLLMTLLHLTGSRIRSTPKSSTPGFAKKHE